MPRKKQRKYYSGKKKRHTLKTQVIYHPRSNQIIGIDIAQGCNHDISLARKTRKKFMQCQYVMVDLGYYGLEETGFKLLMPIKKSKGFSLSLEQKQFNRQLSRFRIKIEHINRVC